MEREGVSLSPGAVLVSGATGSLGRAIAKRLSRSEREILVGFRSSRAKAEEVAAAIKADGGSASCVALDLTSRDGVESAILAAEAAGGLGTLIYASGAQPNFDYLANLDLDEWRRVLEIELFGLLTLVRASLPQLRRSKGAIVTIATYQASRLESRGALSTVPKAAAERIMAVVAKEEARFGVRANVVRAGWISGGFGAGLLADSGREESMLKKIPLGRLGFPEEVAEAVAFLASTQAAFTTGAVLTVDGGHSL